MLSEVMGGGRDDGTGRGLEKTGGRKRKRKEGDGVEEGLGAEPVVGDRRSLKDVPAKVGPYIERPVVPLPSTISPPWIMN